MFGISIEHLLLVFIILLIFGPTRLPQAGAYLGKAIRNFKEQWKGIGKDVKDPIIEADYKHVDEAAKDKEEKKS